jgi:hypothetical protein
MNVTSMGIHVPYEHIWRINKSSSGHGVTLRDMTCVDPSCETWPTLETQLVEKNSNEGMKIYAVNHNIIHMNHGMGMQYPLHK